VGGICISRTEGNAEMARSRSFRALFDTMEQRRDGTIEGRIRLIVPAGHRECGFPGRGNDICARRTPVADKILAVDDIPIEDHTAEARIMLGFAPVNQKSAKMVTAAATHGYAEYSYQAIPRSKTAKI
jgi:hypothetical protein